MVNDNPQKIYLFFKGIIILLYILSEFSKFHWSESLLRKYVWTRSGWNTKRKKILYINQKINIMNIQGGFKNKFELGMLDNNSMA